MHKNTEPIKGFSLIELMIVLVIISIMSGVTAYYLNSHRTLYKPDEQSLQIVDIFQEARQRSLTQRVTLRVEIDLTVNMIRLINENTAATEADDQLIRQIALLPSNEVIIENRPPDILLAPPETLPAPAAVFKPSIYPSSATHRVCTMRFQPNGMVVDAGNSPTGTGATATGVTLYIWSPNKNNTGQSDIARAITVIGTTGSVRLWEYNRNSAESNKWIDSRRTGGFGGTGN